MRIAYLTAEELVTGARGDAFEHQRMMEVLVPAFAAEGMALHEVVWTRPEIRDDWDAVLIGTPWDYWSQREAFLAALEGLSVPVLNPLAMVRWSLDKAYLRDLAAAGVPGIPTVFLDRPDAAAVEAARQTLGAREVVIKRRVGAGGYGQLRLGPDEASPPLEVPVLVQPFVPSIVERGETSLVFVGGALSHSVRKLPGAGDYRIQSLYGGREVDHVATVEERRVAEASLDAVTALGLGEPVYARADVVWRDDGPALMELELVEPYLYPEQGPEVGVRLAAAVGARLGVTA